MQRREYSKYLKYVVESCFYRPQVFITSASRGSPRACPEACMFALDIFYTSAKSSIQPQTWILNRHKFGSGPETN